MSDRIVYISSEKSGSNYFKNFFEENNIPEYSESNIEPEIVIVIGGDGFMLKCLHRFIGTNIKLYGINSGSIGFMLHEFDPNILSFISNANQVRIYPLKIKLTLSNGNLYEDYAFNEFYLLRDTPKIVVMKLTVNGIVRIGRFSGDGMIVSTALGSTAYNFSAGGAMIPMDAPLVSLTGINVFRPRRFKTAILPRTNLNIKLDIDASRSSALAYLDGVEFGNIASVEIEENSTQFSTLLFDSRYGIYSRYINEQFI